MTAIADIIAITVNVQDLRLSRQGFGTPLILANAESSVFAARTKSYASIDEVDDDFAAGTKPYRAANAIFSQQNTPPSIKVGRQESGDADITAALNAVIAEDDDWYFLLLESVVKQDIIDAAAWCESNGKLGVFVTEDEDVIAAGSSDVASSLKASTRNRSALMWHKHAGREASGVDYTVSSEVVTVTDADHGLEVGDPLFISSSSGENVDGSATIASVPTSSTFTFVKTGAGDEAGPDTLDYIAGYTYANAAWVGLLAPQDPGSVSWKFKRLTGVEAMDLVDITSAEEVIGLGKNANLYTLLGATGVGITHEGVLASGRYIDIQRGLDWISARLGENISARLASTPKVPYTDAGMTIIEAEIAAVLDQALTRNILGPLLDGSGKLYRITIPKVSAQSAGDRASRIVSGITVDAQLAGAIHKINMTVNLQV